MKLLNKSDKTYSVKNWLISALSYCCQLAGQEDKKFELSIQQLLAQIISNIGYDEGFIILFNDDQNSIYKVHSYRSDLDECKINFYTQIILNFLDSDLLEKDNMEGLIDLVHLVSDLDVQSNFKQNFDLMNISSFVLQPLSMTKKCIGYMVFVLSSSESKGIELNWKKCYHEFAQALTQSIILKNRICSQHNCMKSLEEMNKELKNFAYFVSHELKRPIGMSRHYLQQSINEYPQNINESHKCLVKASERLESLNDLINKLLYYSSVSWREGELVNVDLNEVVQEAVKNFEKEQSIQIFFDNALPEICFDRFLILQIFENLISNAIKYTDKEVKEICIGSFYDYQKETWLFWVKDNGIGISPDNIHKVFDLFYKINSTNQNTGIGLALVKKIIESYEGQIWVESQVNKGSQFFFILPA